MSLQRSLLSQELPAIDGVELLGHYQAGSAGLEVGGDWYDVVRRSDGIVHISVGDVAGRGLTAAVLMGQMRNAFRAYAYDHSSPAELLRRMRRHVAGDEMATAVCLALDPYTQRADLRVRRPPALVAAAPATAAPCRGSTRRRAAARLRASPRRSARSTIALPPAATVVAYTDGLIERRGWSIDVGIDLLAEVLGLLGGARRRDARREDHRGRRGTGRLGRRHRVSDRPPARRARAHGHRDPGRSRRCSRGCAGACADGSTLRGLSEQERDDAVLSISEACNNAIEHAYGGAAGRDPPDPRAPRRRARDHGRGSRSWRTPTPDPERGRGTRDHARRHARRRASSTRPAARACCSASGSGRRRALRFRV